jgi:hypothetical protein
MLVSPTLEGGAQLGSRAPLLRVQPPRLGCSRLGMRSQSARRLATSLLPALTAAWRSSCLLGLDSYWRGSCRHHDVAAEGGTSRDHRAVGSSSGRSLPLAVHPGPRIAVSKQTGRRTRMRPLRLMAVEDSRFAASTAAGGTVASASGLSLMGLRASLRPRGTLRCGAVSRASLVNSECAFSKSPFK